MAKDLITINSDKTLASKKAPQFQVAVKEISNPHKAQFFIDYGEAPGPWLVVGINGTAYGFGYLPAQKKPKKKASTRTRDAENG